MPPYATVKPAAVGARAAADAAAEAVAVTAIAGVIAAGKPNASAATPAFIAADALLYPMYWAVILAPAISATPASVATAAASIADSSAKKGAA